MTVAPAPTRGAHRQAGDQPPARPAPPRRRRHRPVPRAARAPIVEGARATFLWRGDADEVLVRHRVVGLADPLRLRRMQDTDLWYVTTEHPRGLADRVPVRARPRRAPRVSTSTTRSTPSSRTARSARARCAPARATRCPTGACPTPRPARARWSSGRIASKALRRQVHFRVYLPARFRTRDPLPAAVVHDGPTISTTPRPRPCSTT